MGQQPLQMPVSTADVIQLAPVATCLKYDVHQ